MGGKQDSKKTHHIVKRKGHSEEFDERKLYGSVYASCLAVRTPQGEAELVAKQVTEDVRKWLQDKPEVTSKDIHKVASKHLKIYNPDAGYIYKTHREIA